MGTQVEERHRMTVQIAGSINVDLIQSVDALPRAGETVLALGSARLPGGKGANQAVAAARMGAATQMAGAVGDDESGHWMRDLLEESGVGTDGIVVLDDQPTGLALIAIDSRGENQIIVAPGANASLDANHVRTNAVDARVLLAQLEIPVETARAFFTAPAAIGSVRMLNAAPALPDAASLFGDIDILIVNQHELALYLGLDTPPQGVEEALAARKLVQRDGQIVIVTLGAGGALAVWPDRHFLAPACEVAPVDTIGAGDCFSGALAALLDAGMSVESALPVANAAAALCTQKQGAIPAMPTHGEVTDFMNFERERRQPS
jgi:ribokinase